MSDRFDEQARALTWTGGMREMLGAVLRQADANARAAVSEARAALESRALAATVGREGSDWNEVMDRGWRCPACPVSVGYHRAPGGPWVCDGCGAREPAPVEAPDPRDGEIARLREERDEAKQEAREAMDAVVIAERERDFADGLRVADAGQYRADWPGAVERCIRERDRARADLAAERAAHDKTRDTLDALRRNSGDVLGQALDELHEEREAHAGTIRLLRTMTDGYEDACNTIARYSEADGIAPPPPVKSVALVREYLGALRAAPRAEGETK